MKYYLSLLALCVTFISCNEEKKVQDNNIEEPLVTVVKLETAESYKDYEAAKKFIDIEKVYGEIAKKEHKSPEIIWKELLDFNYSIGNSSPKFINSMPFHKYKFSQSIKGSFAEVILTKETEEPNIKEIIYKLQKKNGKWMVVTIQYNK